MGTMVNVSPVLNSGSVTPGVAGTQNDFNYDSSKLQVVVKKVCKADPVTECTADSDCEAGDTCVETPNCTVNSAIRKEATAFAFLPSGCAGSACNGVRALVFSLQSPNRLIPNGSVLYTCPVNILAGTANGMYPLTCANTVLSFPSPPGGQVPGVTCDNGSVTVGPVEIGTPTNTPTVGISTPTNTATIGVATATSTPTTGVNTPTRTATKAASVTPSATAKASATPGQTVTGVVAQNAAAGANSLVLADASGFGSSGTITKIGTQSVDIGYTRSSGSNTLNLDTGLPFAVPAETGIQATVGPAPSPQDEDGCDCRIATPGGSQRSWLLLIPVAALLMLRRKRR
jgi:MYXO-CTERM domain-containing protein